MFACFEKIGYSPEYYYFVSPGKKLSMCPFPLSLTVHVSSSSDDLEFSMLFGPVYMSSFFSSLHLKKSNKVTFEQWWLIKPKIDYQIRWAIQSLEKITA